MRKLHERGFTAHVLTSDGAQWNRGVCTRFGISVKDQKMKTPHPMVEDLDLYCVSDFPHLIKNLRTGFLTALRHPKNPSQSFDVCIVEISMNTKLIYLYFNSYLFTA